MSRGDLTSGLEDATLAAVVRPLVFISGEFESGTLRFWSGLGPIDWDGETWTGAGGVIGFAPAEETAETRAAGGTITLNGVSSDIISTVLGEAVQGKPIKAWVGALDDTGAIVVDPYQLTSARLDVPTIDDAGDTCTVSVSYENELGGLIEGAPDRRYTTESHKLDQDGDLFFDFVPQIQDRTIPWGRKA